MHSTLDSWFVAIVAVLTACLAYVFDWIETHVYNPNWPPHAKFHNAQTLLLGPLLGTVSLVLLLVGAGLLMRSLYDLITVNTGFNPQSILTLKISPNESFCKQREACIAFYDRLLERARLISGVIDAAVVNTLPLNHELPAIPTDVEDHPRTADFPSPMLWAGAISPNYLRLMQIQLLSGREFRDADGPNAPPVILISASTARRFWPGINPIGKHIKRSPDTGWRTIIGVVSDVKQFSLAGRSVDWLQGAVYMPYAQAVQGDWRRT
jgi:MacB-like periplasmic core domain